MIEKVMTYLFALCLWDMCLWYTQLMYIYRELIK